MAASGDAIQTGGAGEVNLPGVNKAHHCRLDPAIHLVSQDAFS
jgi:hypothetical protein